MSSTQRGTHPESALAAGGAIAMLAVVGQLVTLYSDSDLGTPIGRFLAMTEGLKHVAPAMGASVLLLAGSWNSDVKGRRIAVTVCLITIGALALLALMTVLPDARKIASQVVPVELSRYRSQVARSLVALIGMVVLLGLAVWKFLKRTPLTNQ